jgi:Domain of Unknown Function (DUF1080)
MRAILFTNLSTPRTLGFGIAMVLGCGLAWSQAPVVPLPKPDTEGWIKLFRGTNTSDFYSFMGTGRLVPSQNKGAFPNNVFTVVAGDTIQSSGSPQGHLIFKQPFSHYRVSFQMRWPGNLGNTGLLTKVQEDDTAQSQGFPRSVECQGDPTQGIGQIWALGTLGGQNGGTWITFHGKKISHPASWAAGQQATQFDPTSPEIDFGGGGDPYNNLIVGKPGYAQPKPAALNNGGWVTVEVESHGKDTTRHFVDGELVMEYHSPRIAARNNASQLVKYLTAGQFAWQSEGSRVWFRNMKIKLLPEDPLYASLYPTTAIGTVAKTLPHRGLPILEWKGNILKIRAKTGKSATLSGRVLQDF